MIIKKTIYVETVEIIVLGSSRWRKAGLEAELEDGEDAVKASAELKKMVDAIHVNNNADVDTFLPPIPREKIDPKIERMKTLIEGATTKLELDNYRKSCPKELIQILESKYLKLKK